MLSVYEKLAKFSVEKLSDTDTGPRKLALEVLDVLLKSPEIAIKTLAQDTVERIKTNKPRAYKALIGGEKVKPVESRNQVKMKESHVSSAKSNEKSSAKQATSNPLEPVPISKRIDSTIPTV